MNSSRRTGPLPQAHSAPQRAGFSSSIPQPRTGVNSRSTFSVLEGKLRHQHTDASDCSVILTTSGTTKRICIDMPSTRPHSARGKHYHSVCMLVSRLFFIFMCATCTVSPLVFAQAVPPSAQPSTGRRQYVGSTTGKTCHPRIYGRWEKTRMANVVRDPKQHPRAILPDLSKPDPLVIHNEDDGGMPVS